MRLDYYWTKFTLLNSPPCDGKAKEDYLFTVLIDVDRHSTTLRRNGLETSFFYFVPFISVEDSDDPFWKEVFISTSWLIDRGQFPAPSTTLGYFPGYPTEGLVPLAKRRGSHR